MECSAGWYYTRCVYEKRVNRIFRMPGGDSEWVTPVCLSYVPVDSQWRPAFSGRAAAGDRIMASNGAMGVLPAVRRCLKLLTSAWTDAGNR